MDTDNKKKKPGFGLGALAGAAVTAAAIVGGANLYCRISGEWLVFGKNGHHVAANHELLDSEAVDKIEELSDNMELYYYEDYDEDDIRDSMYAGVMEGLGDPYSVYYTAEEYADQQLSTSGVYYGIGAGLSQDPETMQVTITKVYEGTPSEEAGLKKDDILVKVDSTEAVSEDVNDLVQKIRGEEGTTVHLQIYRPSTEETLEFDVERRNVELPSVSGQMLEDGIGYIQISEFQRKTGDQFEAMVQDLKDQGMNSMIIDIRSNPGGMLSTVVQILDDILPEGTLVYTQDKYGQRQDYTSDASCMDYPMAVLIDGNSASASEIFAGAVKDYDYGTLIGTTTFGKGIVQTILPLKDGDAIKITTSKYYTPKGNYIHEVGIDPDIELEYKFTGPEDGEYEIRYDNQIQKAIEVLTSGAHADES